MRKDVLTARVESIVAQADGYVSVQVPGNVSSFAFVRFSSSDTMQACVDEVNKKGLPGDIRFKPNRSKEARKRSSTYWSAKQALIKAGWTAESLSVSTGKIFEVDANGNASLLGKLIGEQIEWEPHVACRVTAA